MKKIITLFQRNYESDRLVRDEVVPGAEWVLNGEGAATRKFDGTCCLIRKSVLYKRYDAKTGQTPPTGFEAAQDPDPVSGHWPGWLAIGDGNEDRWHREAYAHSKPLADGTYELCGPKIQANPEGFETHVLVLHGSEVLADAPRTYHELKDYLRDKKIEGIVWHHPDGRMVKIKCRDFFKDGKRTKNQ